MPIGLRNTLVAGMVLAACAVAVARHAATRMPVDPCDADPGIYACAMFAQPDWLKRRVYAGRMETRLEPRPGPVMAVEAVAVSTSVAEPADDGI